MPKCLRVSNQTTTFDPLHAFSIRSQKEVAALLHCTRQNVQRLEHQALRKIRERLLAWRDHGARAL
jgi:cob(I)alamin adenosyltransferase